MADSGDETDIGALKEALCTQQQLLQEVVAELDVERESAATAASEALSMILRLQGEKAAVKMEASQYKRLAEEKIGHAEESLAIFEQLIYQKEMEISSLEYQVEAYRYKLLSLGCSDMGAMENKYPENLLLQSDAFVGFGFNAGGSGGGNNNINNTTTVTANATVRRLSSLPVPSKDTKFKTLEITPLPDLLEQKSQQDQSLEAANTTTTSAAGDFNYYWEQIKKLDERVKQITDGKDNNSAPVHPKIESRTGSLVSHKSIASSLDPTRAKLNALLDEMKSSDYFTLSSSVHDIFEVPEINDHSKTSLKGSGGRPKLLLEGKKNRLGKPDDENFVSPTNEETEWEKKIVPAPSPEKRPCKLTSGKTMERRMSLGQSTVGMTHCKNEVPRPTKRIELLEGPRSHTKHEIGCTGAEGINMLREIQQQLNSIQSELRSILPRKSPPPDDSALVSLMEGMLYFWL